jgi:hypothetical protein
MKQIGTMVIGLVVATLSPFIVLSMIGLCYVMYLMVGHGLTWANSIAQFVGMVWALQPYFGYLTAIPLVFGVAMMAIRRRRA